MLREDYLMRHIQRLVDAIARIAGLNQREAHDQALAAAEQAWEELLEIPPALADRLDAATLAGMLREPAKLRLAAQLLVEQARGLAGKGEPVRASVRYRRAMELVLEARAVDPSEHEADGATLLALSRVVPSETLAPRYRVLV